MLNIDRAFLKTLVVIKSFLIEDHLFNDRVFSCNLKYCLHGSHIWITSITLPIHSYTLNSYMLNIDQ